jgi:hypothetical protein
MFVFSLSVLIFGYGFFTHRNHIFPYKFLKKANDWFKLILSDMRGDKRWYYRKTEYTEKIPIYEKKAACSGLSLVTSIIEKDSLSVKIIDMDGSFVHGWNIDWFEIWPDATHIPKESIPKSRPGTHIHGNVLLDNCDLVFNFTLLGLVRLDVCGNVVWRLPYRTHHSIYRDEYNNLWVSGQKIHKKPLPRFPKHKPPFIEETVLKISLDGKILNEISMMDLLKENDLQSLLIMSSKADHIHVSGDTLHLNDVETFPSFKEEGAFKAGDIMVSLRNINTILIFTEKDRKVKYMSIGGFIRQHDPDFFDGNTISVFDNNNIESDEDGNNSRIVMKSLIDNRSYVYYSGSKDKPFYTSIMGKHQWLKNGNLLITESMKGRAFEINKRGKIVWEYINILEDGYIGIVEEVQRLSNKYTKEFIDRNINNCRSSNLN